MGLRVGDGESEAGDVPDADEIELRVGRHLGHDLGDRRAVTRCFETAGPAVVDLDDRLREIARGLALPIPAEAEVDNCDLHAVAARAGLVPSGGPRRGDTLAPNRLGHGARGLTNEANSATSRERRQRSRRDARLDHPAVSRLDLSSYAEDGRSSATGTSCQQLHANAAGAQGCKLRVQSRDLDGMGNGVQRLARVPERACAAHRSPCGGEQPAQHPQYDPPHPSLPSRSHLRDSCNSGPKSIGRPA